MTNYREKIFWLRDYLSKERVSIHYKDVKNFVNKASDVDRRNSIEERLTRIVDHAKRTTIYYQERGITDIKDFPVIDKNLIRENYNDFVSSKFLKSDLVKVTTSGSTGTPFSVYHDKNKRKRNTADTIYFGELGGYFFGNKLCYFKIWSSLNYKSVFKRWRENIECIEVLNLSEECESVILKLNNLSGPLSFMGYSSAFETMFKFLDFNSHIKLDIKGTGVITISESLNEYTKKKINEYFGCEVYSRYSNIENGIIAQQMKGTDWFRINQASYFIEIMDEQTDVVLPHGQLGRIIVTDLFNYGMPLIRYDTGDLGVLEKVDIGGNKEIVLKKIEGRKLDQIFNTKGDLISSYIVYKNMFQYTELFQYQFIQKSKKSYLLKLMAPNGFEKEEKLINEFKEYLGNDASINIEYVQEIPLLSSGKRKKVVNEMNNK